MRKFEHSQFYDRQHVTDSLSENFTSVNNKPRFGADIGVALLSDASSFLFLNNWFAFVSETNIYGKL